METNAPTNEEKALSALRPSVNLTIEEKAALAMWTSDPPQYPELSEEETAHCLQKARQAKGQLLYQQAYARRAKGVREFPQFTAKEFVEFIQKRGNARAVDRQWKAGKFDRDADNRHVLGLLSLYFTGDPRFNTQGDGSYSLNKGIYLCGGTGVGKSELMELCGINPYACFNRYDCRDIALEYTEKDKGGSRVIDHYTQNILVDPGDRDFTFGQPVTGRYFDDLGEEDLASHMGNKVNVLGQIIENRYRNRQFQLTHFTSNHTIDELLDAYGARVVDRLREMCNVIQYPHTAKSRRR